MQHCVTAPHQPHVFQKLTAFGADVTSVSVLMFVQSLADGHSMHLRM